MTQTTQDRIILSNLGFYGYHGVMLEENKLGQRFFIDVECGMDLRPAGHSDEVEKTVSYAHIYDLIKEAVEETRYKLIEALAQHISDHLFEACDAFEWVRLRIRKPEAPVPQVCGSFAVEIYRTRNG